MITLKYFDYYQNNSGGSWDFDAAKGVSTNVIIQARDAREADYRAERIGLYFDGDGDCPCCGYRWYGASGGGTDEPTIHGSPIQTWISGPHFTKWMGPDLPEVFVHLYDDRFAGFVYGNPKNGTLRLTEIMEVTS